MDSISNQTTKKQVLHRHPYEKEWGFAGVVKSGDLVFVSGIVSLDKAGKVIAPYDMNSQVEVVYQGIVEALALAGATLDDVLKETIHTTDLDAFIAAMPIRARFFAPHSLAASAAWHEVTKLAQPGLLVEVEVIARVHA
jgi:2-iminobutanoate/2-iminopropanoate deaminase